MRTATRGSVGLLATSLLIGGLVSVAPAGAVPAGAGPNREIHVVHPGPHAIQNAVDAAAPGDTVVVRPGTYRESIIVTKSLNLRGAGAGPGGTLIRQPANPGRRACVDPGNPRSVQGICVFGRFDNQGNVTRTVRHVNVSGFDVRGFSGNGILVLASADVRVTDSRARGNGEYGIAGFVGKRSVFAHNTAVRNAEPGLYMGDSPNAGSRIVGNVSRANEFGIFMRDSTDMVAAHNRVVGNCIGIFPLDTGGPTAAGNYAIRENDVVRNNKACPGAPPFSGLGVFLGGVRGTTVARNRILGNRPSGPSAASGGIVMFSTAEFGGGDPRNNTVQGNIALRNRTYDIDAAGFAAANTFRRNTCRTAVPVSLC